MKNLCVCNPKEGFVILAGLTKLVHSGEQGNFVVLQPTKWDQFWNAWNSKHKSKIRELGIIPKKLKDENNEDYWEVRIPKNLYYNQ